MRRGVLLGAALAASVAVRALQSHGAMLYPDGYQYLLMARGIALHLRPALELGPGGDAFVPSADASAKPLFPLLVALGHLCGLSFIAAARAICVAAAGAVVVASGLLAGRATGSRAAAAAAAALCLASPSLGFWSGFLGPDALAQALALGSALALLAARPLAAGALAGACVATRPEYALAGLAAAALAARRRDLRGPLLEAVAAAALTLAALLALVRPPLALPATGRLPPLATLADGIAGHWQLAAAAAIGPVVALCSRRTRAATLPLLAATAALAAAYLGRNAASPRYLAQLVPLGAIGCGLGMAALPPRLRPLLVGGALAAVLLGSRPAQVGPDMFASLARRLPEGAPIVTAAPDAYGFLLYPRPVRVLKPGARGLVLLDAVQRAYEPRLLARGDRVATLPAGVGFLGPDGTIDRSPAVVVRGVVRRAGIAPAARSG